jgi:hypothetical protein
MRARLMAQLSAFLRALVCARVCAPAQVNEGIRIDNCGKLNAAPARFPQDPRAGLLRVVRARARCAAGGHLQRS